MNPMNKIRAHAFMISNKYLKLILYLLFMLIILFLKSFFLLLLCLFVFAVCSLSSLDRNLSQVSQLREVMTAVKRQNAATLATTASYEDTMTIETTLIDQHTSSYPVGCRQHTTPPDYTNTSNTGPQWL